MIGKKVVALANLGRAVTLNAVTKLVDVLVTADEPTLGYGSDGGLRITGRLPWTNAAVGDQAPAPSTGAGTVLWSLTSACAVIWTGTQFLALAQSQYSSSGITTTSSNVTTTST